MKLDHALYLGLFQECDLERDGSPPTCPACDSHGTPRSERVGPTKGPEPQWDCSHDDCPVVVFHGDVSDG